MIQNEPLKLCFNRAGLIMAQATISVLNACNAADTLNRGHVPDVLAVLDKIRGGFGQYFPAGVEVATIQAATTEAVQSLNGAIQAAANASGEPTPPELPPYTFTTSEPLNAGQIGIINACIEFVRVSCCGARWYLHIANGDNYRREAARTVELFGEARQIIPLTPDDEREAAAALVPIREHVEAIRAALNIPDIPKMKPNGINARISELSAVLEYLTVPIATPEQAARIIKNNAYFFGGREPLRGLDIPAANAWNIPDILPDSL